MNCDLCERPIRGGSVVKEQHCEIVNGEFMPTEAPTIRHDECEEF